MLGLRNNLTTVVEMKADAEEVMATDSLLGPSALARRDVVIVVPTDC